MKPVITSASINGQGGGGQVNAGSNSFTLGGSFPTGLGTGDVAFSPSTGSASTTAITGSTASQVTGTFSFSGGQGGNGQIQITVTDPGDNQTSTPFGLQATFPLPP